MVIYRCDMCNYSTHIRTHYSKHLTTKKHVRNKEIYTNNLTDYSDSELTPNDSNLTPIDSGLTPNDSVLNPNDSILNPNKILEKTTLVCEYCNKSFTRKNNLVRHQNSRCKVKKNAEKTNDYKVIFEEYKANTKNQMDNLYKQIDNLIDKVGNVNITQNNIVLNSLGDEDLSHVTNDYMTSLLKIPYGMIPKLIEKVHFSEEKPENNNIYIPNKKQPYLKVFTDKWIYCDRKEIIKKLVDQNYFLLDQHYNTTGKIELDKLQNQRYNDFQGRKEVGDDNLEEQILKETDLVLLNYTPALVK